MLSILVTQFVVLWAVIDPIGSVPVYLSQTQHLTAKQRRWLLKQSQYLLACCCFLLQVSNYSTLCNSSRFQAAGGLVLLLFALTMIFGESKPEQETKLSEEVSHSDLADLAVYPLAIPSIASPGAMMAIVLLTDNHRYSAGDQLITAAVMMTVLVITLLLLLGATHIQKWIGNVGAAIISRVMGLILATVAVNTLMGSGFYIS